MDDKEVADFCDGLIDRFTVVRGYLQMNIENKKVDYTIIIIQKLNETIDYIKEMCELAKS